MIRTFLLISVVSCSLLTVCGEEVVSPTDRRLCVSGVYPHLAMFNSEQECGTGAVVPWAGSLWTLTYGPHCAVGGSDLLYRISPNLDREICRESIGGTHANRLIHRETEQLLIGPYVIDKCGKVTAIPVAAMPGRLTGAARHPKDPTNKVMVVTMEEALYELDMRTLKPRMLVRTDFNKKRVDEYVKKNKCGYPDGWDTAYLSTLPGYHGKGFMNAFGKVFYANNGEVGEEARRNPYSASGALASWEREGEDYTLIRRNQFTEITTKDGIYGNEHPDDNTVWALGWDAKSVLLAVCVNDVWTYYRLPKGSHSYDGAHGWNTEWPRIREIGSGDVFLATMHGTFWRFPSSFTTGNAVGIRPISNYLKVIGDFCKWNDKLVLGCDDAAKSEFLNKRRVKGEGTTPGRSQSNLRFVTEKSLGELGPLIGRGGVWSHENLPRNAQSDPYLLAGYDHAFLWVKHSGKKPLALEVMGSEGDGKWRKLDSLSVPVKGLGIPVKWKTEWVRFCAKEGAEDVSVVIHHSSLGDWPLDHSVFTRSDQELQEFYVADGANAPKLNPAPKIPTGCLEDDGASLIYIDDNNTRWRLPRFNGASLPDKSRVCREVVTERDLFNLGGIFYELPAENAGGFSKIRPVSSHSLKVRDYGSWRGLLVLLTDDGMRFGEVDDIWKLGKPKGVGGTWKDSSVKAGKYSEPFLLTGFDRKTVTCCTSKAAATITCEVDIDGNGTWVEWRKFKLAAGERRTEEWTAEMAGYWLRTISDTDTVATFQLNYD